MATLPGVSSIDELLVGRTGIDKNRADYLANNSGLIIELKTLEEDTEGKVEKILEPHRARPEFPSFFGKWELTKILKHLPDGEDINRQITQSLTTSVRAIFRKANAQISSTKEIFNLPDSQGLLIILNQNVEVLNPQLIWRTVTKIAHAKKDDGTFRYSHLRAVLLLSELHGKELPGNVLAHPVLLMPFANGEPFEHNVFVHDMNVEWSKVNDADLVESADGQYRSTKDFDFENVSALFDERRRQMPRHEVWARQYKRNPYFRKFDEEGLGWFFRIILFEISRGMMKGGTRAEGECAKHFWLEVFTHFMEEVDHRGIDIRVFTSDERAWKEIDDLMARRFSDFEPPTRDWVEDYRKRK